jgi:glycosyltransferase 2 family protein
LAQVTRFWERPGTLLLSVAIALVFQAMLGCIYLLLGQSLSLPVPPAFYFVLCPIVSLAALSPITLNGLGERVAATVILLSLLRVEHGRAVALGLAWTGMVTVASLCGGAVLFFADRWGGGSAAEAIGRTDE